MSRTEPPQPAIEPRDVQWTYAAPAPDEESEIVAQFLAAPYPCESDQLDQEGHGLGGSITACGAMYWPSTAGPVASNSGGGGGYFDEGCCYNTLSCGTSIDLNLAGHEEIGSKCDHLVPDPSPVDCIRASYLDDDGIGCAAALRPKRKVQTEQEGGGDLGRHKKKARAADRKKQGKKAVPKTVQKVSMHSNNSSYCSDDESNCSQENRRGENNAKARADSGSATSAQSLYARKRRERINEKLRILQRLVPNGTKMDISTMLEEAVHYVKLLQLQIKMLSSDDMWMHAPIAYNGMSLGLDLRISPPQ